MRVFAAVTLVTFFLRFASSLPAIPATVHIQARALNAREDTENKLVRRAGPFDQKTLPAIPVPAALILIQTIANFIEARIRAETSLTANHDVTQVTLDQAGRTAVIAEVNRQAAAGEGSLIERRFLVIGQGRPNLAVRISLTPAQPTWADVFDRAGNGDSTAGQANFQAAFEAALQRALNGNVQTGEYAIDATLDVGGLPFEEQLAALTVQWVNITPGSTSIGRDGADL